MKVLRGRPIRQGDHLHFPQLKLVESALLNTLTGGGTRLLSDRHFMCMGRSRYRPGKG